MRTTELVTQWVRLGVDTENPWDSFNTLGIQYKDIEALEKSIEDQQTAAEDEDDGAMDGEEL